MKPMLYGQLLIEIAQSEIKLVISEKYVEKEDHNTLVQNIKWMN